MQPSARHPAPQTVPRTYQNRASSTALAHAQGHHSRRIHSRAASPRSLLSKIFPRMAAYRRHPENSFARPSPCATTCGSRMDITPPRIRDCKAFSRYSSATRRTLPRGRNSGRPQLGPIMRVAGREKKLGQSSRRSSLCCAISFRPFPRQEVHRRERILTYLSAEGVPCAEIAHEIDKRGGIGEVNRAAVAAYPRQRKKTRVEARIEEAVSSEAEIKQAGKIQLKGDHEDTTEPSETACG